MSLDPLPRWLAGHRAAVRRTACNLLKLLAVAVAGSLLAAGLASAQSLAILNNDGDERLLECLNPPGIALPPLLYPPDALTLKRDATVRVWMEFTRPDAPPKASVMFNVSGEEFSRPVLKRVNAYRLPCFPAGRVEPVVVTQEFQFDARDGRPVTWNPPLSTHRREQNADCRLDMPPGHKIDYPSLALKRDETGTSIPRRIQSGVVLAWLESVSADAPPKVEILHDAGSRVLAAEVKRYVQATRLHCANYPVQAVQPFKFHIEGDEQVSLKDMSLQTFAGFIMDLDKQKVRFDFTTMKCPFAVQIQLFQPFVTNSVGEVGEPDPNRGDFLRWLSSVQLKLPPKAAKHLIGATTRVTVPCGSMDLRD